MSIETPTGQKESGTTDADSISLSYGQHKTLQKHAIVLDERIPADGGPFGFSARINDIPRVELPRAVRKQIHSDNLVVKVGEFRKFQGSRPTIWGMPPAVRARVRRLATKKNSPCGCGHSGISNLGGGRYTCGRDYCDVVVSRAEVNR